jgi:hypothetical protein
VTHLHLVPRSKNVWRYTSTPNTPSCLVKHRDNFTFTFTFIIRKWGSTWGLFHVKFWSWLFLSLNSVKIYYDGHMGHGTVGGQKLLSNHSFKVEQITCTARSSSTNCSEVGHEDRAHRKGGSLEMKSQVPIIRVENFGCPHKDCASI